MLAHSQSKGRTSQPLPYSPYLTVSHGLKARQFRQHLRKKWPNEKKRFIWPLQRKERWLRKRGVLTLHLRECFHILFLSWILTRVDFIGGNIEQAASIGYFSIRCCSGQPNGNFCLSAESKDRGFLAIQFLPRYRKNRKKLFLPKEGLSAEIASFCRP